MRYTAPMTILLLCEDINGTNGWSTYARDLLHALRARGHDVKAGTHDGTWGSLLPHRSTLLSHPWLAPFYAWRLKRICGLVRPDVIHVAVESYALLIPYLPKEWRDRTCLTVHGTFGVAPLKDGKLKERARDYYDVIPGFVTVSAYTKEKVTEALRAYCSEREADAFARKATVVHNGIVLPPYEERKDASAIKSILLVGGVKPRKGVIEALRGCAAYRDRSETPFRFTVVGSTDRPEYLETVRSEIAALKLEKNVTLTGMIGEAELETLYRNADAFLMPSVTTEDAFEGFGLVFLEANARGVPVIGPDTSGTAEAIGEGKSGYRVDVHDPSMIAERLAWILDDQTISGASCRRWAEDHSIARCAERTEAAYETIIAGAPTTRR